ncbi:MAG: hypothetical protein AAB492_04295 [Patescibacteria group bacterium]
MARKWIWNIIILGFVLFSLLPTLYELKRSGDLQPNRQFELVHNFPTDYNFYLSRIRQGLEGRWTSVERYTSEPHDGSLIHELYVLMGRVGASVRVPWGKAGDVYHVARVVLAVTLLALIAKYTNYNILAFLLVVTASSWSKLVFVEGIPRFGGYMPWWSVMDSLQRITFIPHLLAGQALIVFLVMMLPSRKNTIFLGILALLLGMVFPPGLLFVYTVMGVYALLQGKGMVKFITPYLLIFLISMPSLVYLGLMTHVYPWKRLIEVDVIRPLPFDYLEYIKAIGPIGPIGLIGLIVALWKRERGMFLSVAWVISWIGLLVVFKFVPQQSPLRFSEMIPHVPLGVLSAYLLYKIGRPRRVVAIVLIAMGLLHMYSSWLWQRDFIDHKIRATSPLVPTGSFVMYPLKDFVAGMGYIQDNFTVDSVVLSGSTAGNYIPAYIGRTVYMGHDNTVSFEKKKEIAAQFFAGRMSPDDAKLWMKQNALRVVFYGPEEKSEAGVRDLRIPYPFLINRYSNAYVTVYSLE